MNPLRALRHLWTRRRPEHVCCTDGCAEPTDEDNLMCGRHRFTLDAPEGRWLVEPDHNSAAMRHRFERGRP